MNRDDRISLDQPTVLRGRVAFAVTKKCFLSLEKEGKNAEAVFQSLSARKHLLFLTRRKNDTTSLCLYHADEVFFCASQESDVLLLTGCRPAALRDNNDCLKYGTSVQPSGGISVDIKLNLDDYRRLFTTYYGGQAVSSSLSAATANQALLALLVRNAEGPVQPREMPDGQPHTFSEEAEKYLSLAEAYTQTDGEIQRAKAQQTPPLVYRGFHAAHAYDRQDKTAYTTCVDGYDETSYAVGTKVELEIGEEKTLAASIIDAAMGEDGQAVTLLFDEQIALSSLPRTGQIRLSYSDVQNEVRKDVIEGIRKGEVPAESLETILGNHQTAGMERKDLGALERSLREGKRPPNESQIKAIRRGIETKDILLVQGPPGTGKTTVIVEWVKYFVKQEGKRVLISSQNNKAVDNVLERLTEEKDISAIRAGNEAKVDTKMYPYLLENRLKQLREDVEAQTERNLRRMEDLNRAYQEYLALVDQAAACAGAVEEAEAQMEAEVEQKYARYRDALLKRQTYRAGMKRDLQKKLSTIRFYEKWIVDREQHPVLFILLNPVRRFLQKRLRTAVGEYKSVYVAYMASLNQSRQEYQTLTGLTANPVLKRLASRIAALERTQEELRARLTKPIDESAVWPAQRWPHLPPQYTVPQLKALRLQVEEREKRLWAMMLACNEWREHIQSQSNYALSDLLLESVDLVGGTCIGINSQRKFGRIDFDVTIIDEAGQIQIHNALVPMSRSPKTIMLGDHQQIPPMVDEDQEKLCKERGVSPELLRKSLFEHLFEHLPRENKVLLDTQYRMPAQIADLLSEWFYGGEYKSFDKKRGMESVCPQLFRSPFVVLSTSDAGGRQWERKLEMGAKNDYEADLVVTIVAALLSGDRGVPLSPDEVGVISPYGGQVDNIRKKLKRAIPGLGDDDIHDMVASLDSFQGQERDVILYSCTRSGREPPEKPRIGFLKELRRLNVALSRPRQELVFIGDIDFLAACQNGMGPGSEREFSRFIARMRQRTEENGEYILSRAWLERVGRT